MSVDTRQRLKIRDIISIIVVLCWFYQNWSNYGSLRKVSTASENQSGYGLTGQSGCYCSVYAYKNYKLLILNYLLKLVVSYWNAQNMCYDVDCWLKQRLSYWPTFIIIIFVKPLSPYKAFQSVINIYQYWKEVLFYMGA